MDSYDAQNYCKEQNAQLAFFRSESEYQQFILLRPFRDEWIGMKYSRKNESDPASAAWWNSDGSSPFLNWKEGQPDNDGDNERCATVMRKEWSHLEMHDKPCTNNYYFTCRKND